MPKEMLPVVEKPVIQYIVEEAIELGIEDIKIREQLKTTLILKKVLNFLKYNVSKNKSEGIA